MTDVEAISVVVLPAFIIGLIFYIMGYYAGWRDYLNRRDK